MHLQNKNITKINYLWCNSLSQTNTPRSNLKTKRFSYRRRFMLLYFLQLLYNLFLHQSRIKLQISFSQCRLNIPSPVLLRIFNKFRKVLRTIFRHFMPPMSIVNTEKRRVYIVIQNAIMRVLRSKKKQNKHIKTRDNKQNTLSITSCVSRQPCILHAPHFNFSLPPSDDSLSTIGFELKPPIFAKQFQNDRRSVCWMLPVRFARLNRFVMRKVIKPRSYAGIPLEMPSWCARSWLRTPAEVAGC